MGRSNFSALRLRPVPANPAPELTDAALIESEPLDESGAAAFLKCSRRQVRELKRRGLIPFFQDAPGCRVTFPKAGLQEFNRRRLHR